MTMVLLADFLQYAFGITMVATAIFLILLVLVQRGKGGGLAGAFGGMGGQSAFGTKAGDTFTKVTIYVATFWILLCVVAIKMLNTPSDEFGKVTPDGGVGAPAVPGKQDGGSEEGEKGPADSSGIGEASQDGDGEQP